MSEYATTKVKLMLSNDRNLSSMVESWLEDCAKEYMDQEQTEARIAELAEDYVNGMYDIASSRLNTYPLVEFLYYPDAEWDGVADYLCGEYYSDHVYPRDRNPAPRERINPMTYDEMLDVLPPRDIPKVILDRYGCTEGFLMGEPYGTGSDGRNVYPAYGRNARGECFYLGLSPAAIGTVASSQRRAAQRKRARDARAKRTSDRLGRAVGGIRKTIGGVIPRKTAVREGRR